MGQDAASKAQRWSEATQWSLPKREALGLLVPGLFGYRMDTPIGLPETFFRLPLREHYNGGLYWGACGRDPAWDAYFASGKQGPPPAGYIRYGGGGIYTGVLVLLIALWTVLQASQKENSAFSLTERKFIWFWSGVALVCAFVGFGRFAPFYQLFYALPLASTMRNPAKFFHVVEWMLVILFAYGVQGMSRKCLQPSGAVLRGLRAQLRSWWVKAATFDKNWLRGSAIALAASSVGLLIYSFWRNHLVAYLREVQFDSNMAEAIASFSIRQVGWFVLFLTLAIGLLALILSGYFNGRRARLGGILIGLLLVADLGRANVPWVITWNWEMKYATNPVIDLLREKPYEHRVAMLPFDPPPPFALFRDLYNIEWEQQLFQYYNIQSLDVVMMPRLGVDYVAFEGALSLQGTNTLYRLTRRWQLTNTRYLLGAAVFLDALNQEIDPVQHRFRIAARFDIVAKGGETNLIGLDELTAVIKPDGPYAVFDFTGALPRAKLYANWRISTNDQATLNELASAKFDPMQTVLVSDPLPAPGPGTVTNQSAGIVDFTDYAPKRIVLQAKAVCPAVLLLNDRFDSDWKVSVDGRPAELLRCNYLMRGVYLQAGPHAVEFRFEPPVNMLYVSLAAVMIGVLLLGYILVGRHSEAAPGRTGAPSPARQARLAR